MLACLPALPRISLRGYEMELFRRAYGMIQFDILGFTFVMNALVLSAGFCWAVPMNRMLPVGSGALLVIIGDFMGK